MGLFLLAVLVFALALALGLRVQPQASAGPVHEVGRRLRPLVGLVPLALLGVILLNNSLKAMAVILLGVFLGVPPILFIAVNGYILGMLATGMVSNLGYGKVVASLAPHGVIEVPAVLVATALGLAVGREVFRWLTGRESRVRRRLSSGLKVYVAGVLPTLVVAALVEVFVTPLIVGLVAR